MIKNILFFLRPYCSSVAKNLEKAEEKLDFKQLRYISKVPDRPVKEEFKPCIQEIEIDKDTLQLLERLALVDLEGEEALKTLRSSIEFANRIESIELKGRKPLYTVLEYQLLHLREDQVNEGNCREEILQNAKVIEEDYFIAPPGNIPLKQQ